MVHMWRSCVSLCLLVTLLSTTVDAFDEDTAQCSLASTQPQCVALTNSGSYTDNGEESCHWDYASGTCEVNSCASYGQGCAGGSISGCMVSADGSSCVDQPPPVLSSTGSTSSSSSAGAFSSSFSSGAASSSTGDSASSSSSSTAASSTAAASMSCSQVTTGDRSTCLSLGKCNYWTANGYCASGACASQSTSSGCSNYNGCQYDYQGSVCQDVPSACAGLSSRSSCLSGSTCHWSPASAGCLDSSCAAHGVSECGYLDGCQWSGDSSTCQDAPVASSSSSSTGASSSSSTGAASSSSSTTLVEPSSTASTDAQPSSWVAMRFAIDFSSISDLSLFATSTVQELATLTRVSPSLYTVQAVYAGSTIVNISMPANMTAAVVNATLASQQLDPADYPTWSTTEAVQQADGPWVPVQAVPSSSSTGAAASPDCSSVARFDHAGCNAVSSYCHYSTEDGRCGYGSCAIFSNQTACKAAYMENSVPGAALTSSCGWLWNGVGYSCANAAISLCSPLADVSSCLTNTNPLTNLPACKWSDNLQQCTDAPCSAYKQQACSTLVADFCVWSDNNSECQNYPVSCAEITRDPLCSSNGCYFDIWENAVGDGRQVCFDVVGEVMQAHGSLAARSCDYWQGAGISQSAAACNAHGCSWYHGACLAVFAGDDPDGSPSAVAMSNVATWTDVAQEPDSQVFSFHTQFPFDLSFSPNKWWVMAVGSTSSNVASSMAQNWQNCTSLGWLNGNLTFPSEFRPTDAVSVDQLRFNIRDWIERFHNLAFAPWPTGVQPVALYEGFTGTQFNTSLVYQAAMQQVFGSWRTEGTSPITDVSVLSSSMLDIAWRIDPDVIRGCPGVMSSVDGNGDEALVIPTGVALLTDHGGVAISHNTFYLTTTLTGAISLLPNSRYESSVYLREGYMEQGPCASGSGRLVLTWVGQYDGVFDTSIVIGPQSAHDIHNTSRANEEYLSANPSFSPLLNQYFEKTTAFTPSTCDYQRGVCWFSVTRKTECRVLQADGTAFTSSVYANPSNYASVNANPQLVNGAQTNLTKDDVYALLLNQHGFYINVQSCIASICNPFNAAPRGEYDYVSINFKLATYPNQQMSTSLEVTGGLLDLQPNVPAMLQMDLSAGFRALIKIPAQINGVQQSVTFPFVNETVLRTLSIPANREIAPCIRLSDANLDIDLRFGIGASYTFRYTPLQAVDNTSDLSRYVPFPGTTPKNYVELKPYMTAVPKNALIGCPLCPKLPIISQPGIKGVDAFDIPMQNLNGPGGVWPNAKFQALKIELTWYIGAGGQQAGGAAASSAAAASAAGQRRLLQAIVDSANQQFDSPDYHVSYNAGDNTATSTFLMRVAYDSNDTLPDTGTLPTPVCPTSAYIPGKLVLHDPHDWLQKALTSVLFVVLGSLVVSGVSYKLVR